MSIVDRLAAAAGSLTPSEQRAALLLEKDPPKVAFGSLAEVARAAGTSGPTVVRLASKLGFSGFAEMKDSIQEELSLRLAPASERVGAQPLSDLSGRVAAADSENVIRSLDAAGPSLTRVVGMLSDERRRVHVVPSAACRAVGFALVDQLSQLRDGVSLHYGPPTEIARELAGTGRGDVVVVDGHPSLRALGRRGREHRHAPPAQASSPSPTRRSARSSPGRRPICLCASSAPVPSTRSQERCRWSTPLSQGSPRGHILAQASA